MTKDSKLASKEQVEEFYNTFKEHQKQLGINIRHRTIFKNLKKAGLKPDSNVLEIGCGIGTVSSLILKFVTKGSFVGVDISNESIDLAKKMNSRSINAEFIVNDMSAFSHKVKFDFVVLPDVLEHIPIDQHANLFKVVSQVTSSDAVIYINYPEPNWLDWARKNFPEKLQIIDQSLSTQDLLNAVYPSGFKLYSMNSYALHYEENDYTNLIFKKNMSLNTFHKKSMLTAGIENTKSKLF